MQIALDQENTSLPRFRRYAGFTAYVEGWALYGESLGAEIGGYADPLSEFGRYNFNMWRACRLVVDTGMHHKKWMRQRAIDFMMTNTALAQLDVEAEIDRYIAWPGQALAYKIGELTIHRIRADAEQRLGDRFDIRAFHDALLSGGAMPLGILETRMAEWVDTQLGGRSSGGGGADASGFSGAGRYFSKRAAQVSPRPLLLLHGADDTRLSFTCSETIYQWAQEPKEIRLFPGAGHWPRSCTSSSASGWRRSWEPHSTAMASISIFRESVRSAPISTRVLVGYWPW